MSASRRPSKANNRSSSWNYSNAESFSDDIYSGMTFYDTPRAKPYPHYATLPRNFRNGNSNKRQRVAEAPPPYGAMEMLLEDYAPSDSGYSSGATSPEPPEDCSHPPTRQPSLLRHPTNNTRCKSDYYFLLRPSSNSIQQPHIEHGIASDPTRPSISFVCSMQPLSLLPPSKGNKKKRRRITNNDFSKPDADPMTYIRDNCENATRALASHRKLHNCDCDFAYLDNRKRGTGSVWRKGEADEGEVLCRAEFGPQRPCRKRWFTGWFVRQHMKFHDQYCACGCFGAKR